MKQNKKRNIEMASMFIMVTSQHREFLKKIIHEDAGRNMSEAVRWCIDACIRIEQLYGIDACYIAWNDIRLKENQP